MSARPLAVRINPDHVVAGFDCGYPELDEFLIERALKNQAKRSSNTFVLTENGVVVGYYTLCAQSILFSDAPNKLRGGLPPFPVPVVLLARLAVDQRCQGRGIGSELMLQVFEAYVQISALSAAVGLMVHAKDEKARAFYLKWGFFSHKDHENTLFLKGSEIEAALTTD